MLSHSVTAPELARILAALEHTPVEAYDVRRALADLHRPAGRGRTRMYGVDEAALVRLIIRLQVAEAISPQVARAIVTNLAPHLIRALDADAGVALAVHGVRGWLIADPDRAALPDGTTAVSLRSIRRGLAEAMQRVRRAEPTIQLFNRRVLPRDLVTAGAL